MRVESREESRERYFQESRETYLVSKVYTCYFQDFRIFSDASIFSQLKRLFSPKSKCPALKYIQRHINDLVKYL